MKTIEPESGEKIARQIVDLMQSKSIDTCSELQEWMAFDESAANVTNKLSSPEMLTELCEKFAENTDHEEQAARLLKTLTKRKSRAVLYKISSGVAAAVLLLALLVGYDAKDKAMIATTHPAKAMRVNSLKPTLLLEGGQQIELSDKTITNDFVVENNKLNYKGAKENVYQQEVKYNTLSVPKQCTFKIELEDGTEVTLNANSELYYPTRFKGDRRELFLLKGEAYFDVKKGEKPFIVNVKNCSVKVYGTQFNINSYNANNISTTLVKGSVGVSISQIETMIQPNEMFRVGADGKGSVVGVDPSKQLSWLRGEINSYDEPLGILLTKISTWYGVKFTCHDDLKQIKIRTSLDNDLPIEDILTAIMKITDVKINKTEEGNYMIK